MKTMTLDKPAALGRAIRGKSTKVAKKMTRIRRILIPVDFSQPSLDAIDYASRVATRLGAELNLIHVFEPQYVFTGVTEIPICLPDAQVAVGARDHLETIAKDRGIPLRAEHIHVKKGRPFEEICRLASKLHIDLIIIPTRGNTGLKHLTLGSTAERVVRHSPCPVLVLRPAPGAARSGTLRAASVTFGKIVVPTDFSDCSMKGLAYARKLAQEFESTIVLLHSVYLQYPVTSDDYARYDLPLVMEQVEKAARRDMDELVQKTDWEGVKIVPIIESGHAGQQICDRARDGGADLIVTATHGRTGLKHVFVGSTAEFVVRHAPCPVLVVPTRRTSPFV